jgi:hypothetical protein
MHNARERFTKDALFDKKPMQFAWYDVIARFEPRYHSHGYKIITSKEDSLAATPTPMIPHVSYYSSPRETVY